MCHSAHEGPRDHPYHVVDLIVIQGKCCYAMPAPNGSIRAKSALVKTMEISEKE
jgi:hypothetical protein